MSDDGTGTNGPGAKSLRKIMDADRARHEAREASRSAEAELAKAKQLLALAIDDPARFAALTGKSKPAPKSKDTTSELQREVSSLREMLQAREKKEQAAQRTDELDVAREQVDRFIKEHDDFPLLKALGFTGAVFDRMVESQKAGKSLSEVEAARELEDALAARREELVAALGSTKIANTEDESAVTLTNDLTSEAATAQGSQDNLSKDDSLAAMADMLRTAETG